MSPQAEVQLIAVLCAVACALPGAFLVLRRMALVSDAISHSILPGIVIAFFVVQDLNSPLLLAAAAITGVLAVALIESIARTRLVREDAAIGLVFPAMFSVGVILISRYAGNVHLDTDAVLLGELAFAPFDRFVAWGVDFGPKALVSMTAILLMNLGFVALLWKELKVSTLDAEYAAILGISPVVVHYALMASVSVTAVGAFDAVGSILVVALMIAPPACAFILVETLPAMIVTSGLVGAASGLGGYWVARLLDASIAGSMAVVAGALFAGVLLLAPGRGLLARTRRRARQRWSFAERMLLVHLMNHQDAPDAPEETAPALLPEHLEWKREFTSEVVRRAEGRELVAEIGGLLRLTPRGLETARRAIAETRRT